jgi:glycosyltransferase involved in cell wall biosynthesis
VKILETGSPNKYFDALAAGKLTVVNFGGWIKDEIEKVECGIYVDAKDADDFVKKIKPFVDNPSMLKTFQCAARKVAEEKYSRKELGERFASLVLSIGA